MSKNIEIRNEEKNGYVLMFDGKYWGVEYYADGYCRDCYGIVNNIADAKIFKKTEKPQNDGRKSLADFINNAVFTPVVSKLVHTIEILDIKKD